MANFFGKAYGASEMGLSTMTEGISKEGIRELVEVMQAELLKGVVEKLKATEGIQTAITSGWQGKSRDAFLDKMTKAISSIINDLNAEYTDLLKRLAELVESYYAQDEKMMDI